MILYKVGFAQSRTDTNRTDDNGWRQGHWIILNETKKLPDYAPKQKVEEGDYADNKKIGIWVQYFPNGNKKSEVTYIANRPSGYAKMYYQDGTIQEEGLWENNRWVGEYKSYHPNGKMFYEFKYNKSGKRDGLQTYYWDNGKVMMRGEMKEGKEAGIWEEKYENGDLKAKKAFNDGTLDVSKTETYASVQPVIKVDPIQPEKDAKKSSTVDNTKIKPNAAEAFNGNGYAKLYNLSKMISKDGSFKNYRLMDGKDYIYNKDGILVQIAIYKNGVYVGDAPMEDDSKK